MAETGTITKDIIVNQIASLHGGSKIAIKKTLDDFIEVLAANISSGRRIVLKGLGSFEIVTVPAREARHPVTKERKVTAAYKKPKFTPGTNLISAIRSSRADTINEA